MKLITYHRQGQQGFGAVTADGIVELADKMNLRHQGVRGLLSEGRLAEAEALARDNEATLTLEDVTLALPVPDPIKIFCIGVNYMNRNDEYRDNSAAPTNPSVFMRNPMSFVAQGEALEIPPESEQLDYEGEIVLVIGKQGRRIPQADALSHIAGLTIMNEGSVRDWLRHSKFNVTQGKNFDRSGAIGPWIETDLSAIDLTDIKIQTTVNGELRQQDTTASMAFPIARLIEYLSTFATLLPGDLIATGTPTGAGARFDPPKWLREGDVVEVTVGGVGSLSNPVRKESMA
ncbi:fumarylacetoacetate hydrolase family protein [Pelagibius sp. Alg239-R121]|uniref:fumarylacetoacetate hydrolase family protein n=1 Tax=Pelagibius sp. Alg239-R121 TaxID=2993448 RepID=UPI0024A74D04|nr:fumarylacetoacetate hydrolase family protein [Pelagibius sp. Alg239-R121]